MVPLHNKAIFSEDRPLRTAYQNAVALMDPVVLDAQGNPSGTEASRTIRLYAPYFVPEQEFIDLMVEARHRGYTVKIITNSRQTNDEDRMGLVTVGLYRRMRELLDAGVELYLWNGPSTIHRKAGVFGDKWAYIGSDNLNSRAQSYNTENIAFTDDASLITQLNTELDLDLAKSTRLTREYARHDLAQIPGLIQWLDAYVIGFF
jgi:phosphatidylserine/phosphatidylglycerophosphate/cardiolipin synthase-like enzyme